jgi:hypothetical protein
MLVRTQPANTLRTAQAAKLRLHHLLAQAIESVGSVRMELTFSMIAALHYLHVLLVSKRLPTRLRAPIVSVRRVQLEQQTTIAMATLLVCNVLLVCTHHQHPSGPAVTSCVLLALWTLTRMQARRVFPALVLTTTSHNKDKPCAIQPPTAQLELSNYA